MAETFTPEQAKFFLREVTRIQKKESGSFISHLEIALDEDLISKTLFFQFHSNIFENNTPLPADELIPEISRDIAIYTGLLTSSERTTDDGFFEEFRARAIKLLTYGVVCSTAFRHKQGHALFLNTGHWNSSGKTNAEFLRRNSAYEEGIYIAFNPEKAEYLLRRLGNF